ncbi:Hypothetical predicted protein [Marmota monax]|uniref:Uncharacterized protein n=1 Tax=Marmota monax TaxID=9995 RepID=A0A5E4BC32_MARMO|nr:hypothetical protein GHT09_016646 [Marmota monax]VTJ67203.1 Hypothetical predicted protein [Marmota monax]
MDNGPGVGSPKEFSEALHTCNPNQGGVEAWGGLLPSQRGSPPGPLHWNWRQGNCWGRRAGAFEKTGTALMVLSPAPAERSCLDPLMGEGQKCFLYMCIYFFFKL